jgi:hypothetical protein
MLLGYLEDGFDLSLNDIENCITNHRWELGFVLRMMKHALPSGKLGDSVYVKVRIHMKGYIHQVFHSSYSTWTKIWDQIHEAQPDNIAWKGISTTRSDRDTIEWKVNEFESLKSILENTDIDSIHNGLYAIMKAIPYCQSRGYDLLRC